MIEIREAMITELRTVFTAVKEEEINKLIIQIVQAKRIFTYACGREGLMLKALAMRLHHLGLTVHVVGDMTAAPIGQGDLMLFACGPGYVSTSMALAHIAKEAGAAVVVMTANMDGEILQYSDHTVHIPAQTMLVKENEVQSLQPMGCLFEQAQLLVQEYIVLKLIDELKVSESDMRKNHTNLE
jgi:6-phospho-3-hexuloisomerase